MRILFVEDDAEISGRFVTRLSAIGFNVEHAPNAEMALDWPDPDHLAAMVVDIGLPGIDGMELIRRWRGKGLSTPVLILSARGTWQEKVDGLNAGGDDYIVKPVRSEEVAARLNALIRRAGGQTSGHLSAGAITLDPSAKCVWRDGAIVTLTQMEYKLLHLFMHRPGHILRQAEILDQLYPAAKERDVNTIEVHIGRLRRRIGKQAITTIRGLGYRFEQ